MDAPPYPPPAEVDLPALVGTTMESVLSGLLDQASRSPLLAALVMLVVLTGLVRNARVALHTGWSRDPVRTFTRLDKLVLLRRAGQRCEKHRLLLGRCRAVERLEADHVHPWSRGGQTALPNGQVLCHHHNRQNGASIPFGWQVRRLERRRAGYFPSGEPTTVTRRAAHLGRIAA